MTHEELLAEIDVYTICKRPTNPGMVCDNEHLKGLYPEWFALRAVVELHPQDFGTPGEDVICDYCKVIYPCPTIQAIHNVL